MGVLRELMKRVANFKKIMQDERHFCLLNKEQTVSWAYKWMPYWVCVALPPLFTRRRGGGEV